MLTIRQSQFDECAQLALTNFINRMKLHLRRAFPEESGKIGDADLHALIDSGIAKAASHGIEIESGVSKFISLMLIFGTEFDKDPQQSWAQQVLDAQDVDKNTCKGELLYEAALEHTRVEEGLCESEDE